MDRSEQERIALDQPAFARLLGFRLVGITQDELVGEVAVTDELANRNGVMHGGAIMAMADNLGGTATMINLPPGKTTTTVESKTNFLRPIRVGDTATGRSVPLHRGRTTMVWQTTITRGDGKVAAIVTQTQMVIDWKG
ncbi:MAG TPA: PaaI family thioesterase [Paracoccus solventivorans]|uniref:PaaI family thioesterase n=1 Tax=Paracoccus solventivorans TaxID=53463 RepID=A0A832PPR7_9RHOB|nr:PaaI family thioesterase [Paracoccus solventivorans]HHW35289.1 PaaI family thioesterase [Paracoccus solventivorans]HMM08451.1 PaaI family thioesterase [Paracoccus solventivorans]